MKEDNKIGKFKKSWLLTKGSWQALRMDKELFALPVIGFLLSLAVLLVAFIGALAFKSVLYHTATISYNTRSGRLSLWGYAGSFIIGLLLTTVASFIGGAITYGAIERFKGNDPTIKSCLSAAWKRIGSLTAFTAFSYTIGYILSQIANRVPFIGSKIVLWLADAVWRVASFFAIPIIVTSDTPINPLKATKSSVQLIKKVWGESLIVSATVGLVAGLSFVGYFVLTGVVFIIGGSLGLPSAFLTAASVLALVGVMVLILIFSMLSAFVKAAIYYYAVTGESPVQFNQELLRQAFTHRKARRIFNVS